MIHPARELWSRDLITHDEWLTLYAQALMEQDDQGRMDYRTRRLIEKIRDGKIKIGGMTDV